LYLARLPTPARAVVEARDLAGGSIVSDRGRVSFTRDGSAVLFGTAPTPLDSIPADSLADKAIFDLWHWQDERLQPQQRVESRRDRIRSWVTIYHPAIDRHVQLANDTLRNVSVSEDGRIAVATTSLPYAVEAMWGDSKHDVYLIDARTGRRTQLVRGVRFGGGAQLSPSARYVTWFDSGQWNAWDVAAGRRISITAGIPVRLDQETWDTPSPPAPWGLGGWTKDDESVLVYDRYDIWQVDPSGRRAPRVLTDSAGRKSGLVFRVVDLDPEQRYFDRNEVLLLRTFNDVTKAAGFYEDRLGASTPPRPILMENRMFGTPKKAARATQYLVTRQTFREAPDLYSGPSLDRLTRISDANPQLKDFAWGTAQIVRWRSNDGIPLAGILYKPDGFDPAKKYPMVVYFYEQMSDNLHQQDMSYPRNTVKPAHYVSNGYLVFFPDIAYVKGYPGESALKSIVPGVQMLLDSGFVKEDGVGLSGQSWGGYQAAYIITRTNMFSAAFSGAPVANMTSAYGGIRWQTGIARPFQYETGQSRIGGSLWEYPFRYIENSPLFAADRVETPLLIMHNDADGAVPWYQGIEMFVALRRLGKEVYLLNYNDDGHNPRKRANQRDVAMRMKQFFDHHLAGAPAPEWMRRGIPFLQKGADQLSAPLAPAASGQGHDEVH
jgi:dienelactone hydrolase